MFSQELDALVFEGEVLSILTLKREAELISETLKPVYQTNRDHLTANSVICTKEAVQRMPSDLQTFFVYLEIIHFVHFA